MVAIRLMRKIYKEMSQKTLPDYLQEGLGILSIGINPSLPSVVQGFYFANPRNRFWRALNGSGLVAESVVPGIPAMRQLLVVHGFGFTDVVKRPTAGANDLRAADFRRDAPLLRAKILRYQPEFLWFHGKTAYGHYLRYAEGIKEELSWGLQVRCLAGAKVYLSPNPSPANAAFSLAALIESYVGLKRLRASSL